MHIYGSIDMICSLKRNAGIAKFMILCICHFLTAFIIPNIHFMLDVLITSTMMLFTIINILIIEIILIIIILIILIITIITIIVIVIVM